jgi:peptidoglycan lytic transglycosylase
MRRSLSIAIFGVAICVSACARRVPTPTPSPEIRVLETREGLATFYGAAFQGRITASGQPFDMNALVAAHPRYPFGTLVRVTNLTNGRSTSVRIQDRGPARPAQAAGVIIDVSRRAAEALEFIRQGRARVRLDVLEWGNR